MVERNRNIARGGGRGGIEGEGIGIWRKGRKGRHGERRNRDIARDEEGEELWEKKQDYSEGEEGEKWWEKE